jgi:EpsI family protein
MLAASVAAVAILPTKASNSAEEISLETMIPKRFGEWTYAPFSYVRVVNPEQQQVLDRLYSQILSRTYVSSDGYRIMLSLAYGADQRGDLQAHKPEVCYPAQGFLLAENEGGLLSTAFGDIPVRRLLTTLGPRHEPVTYWFTVGDRAVGGALHKRLVELRFLLTGQMADGMLFRVSSIDRDRFRAYHMHDQFVHQLLQIVSASERKRLSGLRQEN